jgi:hypothetical protein
MRLKRKHYNEIRLRDEDIGEIYQDTKCDSCATERNCLSTTIWQSYEDRMVIDLCPDCLRQLADMVEKWGPEDWIKSDES